MFRSLIFVASAFGLLLLLSSCNENNTEDFPLELGYEYFPLEVGKYTIYQVDSVLFDTTGTGVVIDSTQSFIRETIVDTFVDNSGQTNYRIEREWRRSLGETWTVQDVWTALRSDIRAERVEENFRFVKMVFPLSVGRSWDGNQFIDINTNISVAGETIVPFKNWFYEILSVGEPGAVGVLQFDEVAEITQADAENFIELRRSFERYARGVGLIYREMWILDTQRISETDPWEEKAQKGFILKQRLIEHN
ncbi:MAG: hypothetical protein AAGG75_09225 [Bacteroidota bacterium]